MNDKPDLEDPSIASKKERADAVAKALGEAARRTRLSKKNKQHLSTDQFRGRRGKKLTQRIKRWSFALLFIIPSSIFAFYYFFIASNQYAAETRFTVLGGLPPKLDTLGSLTGIPSALAIQDTAVVIDYIFSRGMVEQLDKTVGLKTIYSKPSIDFWSRMDDSASIEKAVKYWKSMVDISLHMPGNIVTLKVRAYSPADADRVANAMLTACEALVNEMNNRMIHDSLAASEAERRRAEDNLATARARLESARNTEGLLSADRTAKALNGLLQQVNTQLGQLQQEYNAQRRYVAEDAPQLRDLSLRIDAAHEEVKALQAHMTGAVAADGSAPLTKSISNLDYLNLENTIAEKIYASSLVLLEHAHLASEAKLLYLNVFVRPSPAEEPDHSKRRSAVILFILADLAVWIIFTLIFSVLHKRGLLRWPSRGI